jgi:hypothetical protein
MVEWLKVKALSSSPSTAKKKKKRKENIKIYEVWARGEGAESLPIKHEALDSNPQY